MEVGFPVRMVSEGIDWPAWTQAVGSVLAILLTGGLAAFGILREGQRKAEVDRVKMSIALHVALQFDKVLTDAENQCGVDRSPGRAPVGKLHAHVAAVLAGDGVLREALQVVDELSVTDMPTLPAALGLIQLRAAIRGYQGRLEAQMVSPGSASSIDFRPFRNDHSEGRASLQNAEYQRTGGFRLR